MRTREGTSLAPHYVYAKGYFASVIKQEHVS
jgi:hypothetical protein